MTAPRRIQLSRAKGWRMPENTVKVDRSTKWGNPFIVGDHGTAAECVEFYKAMCCGLLAVACGPEIQHLMLAQSFIAEHIGDLRGKNLACWCRAGKPCHADVLLELANK